MRMYNKIVITGSSGMIGAALAKNAVNIGLEVLCIVRKDSKRKKKYNRNRFNKN